MNDECKNIILEIDKLFEHILEEKERERLVAEILKGLELIIQNKEIDVSELEPELLELMEAYENEDWILVSDIMEYEVKVILAE